MHTLLYPGVFYDVYMLFAGRADGNNVGIFYGLSGGYGGGEVQTGSLHIAGKLLHGFWIDIKIADFGDRTDGGSGPGLKLALSARTDDSQHPGIFSGH